MIGWEDAKRRGLDWMIEGIKLVMSFTSLDE